MTYLARKAHYLFTVAETIKWSSYDPFDLLSSPVLAWSPHASRLVARLLVQVGRRLGVVPRRWLLVQPHREAKTLSDFLSAAVYLSTYGESWAERYIPLLAGYLKAAAVKTKHGYGWGLEFPYTSRFVSAEARTPNIYQTANAAIALLDTAQYAGDQESLQYAIGGIRFIEHDLGLVNFNGQRWLRYWPDLDSPIVNVQALAASVLVRMGNITKNDHLISLADQAATTVVVAQRSDGSWRYGEDGRADFVDGFHTGFILQGLAEYLNYRTNTPLPSIQEALEKGWKFFRRHLLSSDGMPLEHADGRPSHDGQNVAQCMQTLALCAASDEDLGLALRLWDKTYSVQYRMMNGSNTRFHQYFSPNFPALRWTVGPFVLATAHLVRALQAKL